MKKTFLVEQSIVIKTKTMVFADNEEEAKQICWKLEDDVKCAIDWSNYGKKEISNYTIKVS